MKPNSTACSRGAAARRHLYLVLALCLPVAWASCGGRGHSAAPAARPPAQVSAITVQPGVYKVTETFPASLEAHTIVQLRADVTGYLKSIEAADGSQVRQGQLLYVIDQSRYQAAYNQAKAALEQARADLSQRQRDEQRYKDLLSHDAIARQTVDQAETAVKTAQANLAAAQAALDRAATDLSHAGIRAPVSGRLGIVQVKRGDIVNAGQTLINTIVDDDPMYVDFEVPQARFGEFSRSLHDRKLALAFYLKLADSSRYAEPGKLVVVNNTVDPASGTVQIRLQFPNREGILRSGMNGVVELVHPSGPDAVAVPTRALVQTLAETSVLTLGPGNVVQSTPVVPGPVLDSLVLIKAGLKAGDRVVVDGLQNAHPGDTVQVHMLP